MHLVLVGLDGDASQGGIALNAVGLPQGAVTGGKAVVEQLEQVNLAAGLGQHVKILVVDMDVAVDVGGGNVLGQDIVVDEIFGPLRPILEHGAHGGVGVDVGVFPLNVGVLGVGKGQLLVNVHQVRLALADFSMFGAVEDVSLGGFRVVRADKDFLHLVLNLLHCGHLARRQGADHLVGQFPQGFRGDLLVRHGDIGFMYGFADFLRVKNDDFSVALLYLFYHSSNHPFLLQKPA